jgi:hypothetical protein
MIPQALRLYYIRYGFATAHTLQQLERLGIEPGAERCIEPSVDTIEAAQLRSFAWAFTSIRSRNPRICVRG